MKKILGYTLLAVIGLFIVGIIINLFALGFGIVWLPFYKDTATLHNTQQTINIVYNAQRCINVDATYNQLKQQVPALLNQQIPNAQTALASFESKLPKDQTTWSPQEQQMDGELQADVVGLQQQSSNLQAQYSALLAEPDTQPCLGTLPTFININ